MTRGSRGGGGRGGEGGGGGSAQRDPTSIVGESAGGNVGDDDIAAALSEAGGTSTRPWRAWWTVSGTCLYLLSMERGRMGKRITENGGDQDPDARLRSMCAALFDAPALTLFFSSLFSSTKRTQKNRPVPGGCQEEKGGQTRRRERE